MPAYAQYSRTTGWKNVPNDPGVYLLYAGDECLYVGSSINVQKRLRGHGNAALCDRCEVRPCPIPELARREQELITSLSPRLNRSRYSGRSPYPPRSADERQARHRQELERKRKWQERIAAGKARRGTPEQRRAKRLHFLQERLYSQRAIVKRAQSKVAVTEQKIAALMAPTETGKAI